MRLSDMFKDLEQPDIKRKLGNCLLLVPAGDDRPAGVAVIKDIISVNPLIVQTSLGARTLNDCELLPKRYGYINIAGNVRYVSRVVRDRVYLSGLHPENTRVATLDGERTDFTSTVFKELLYPTYPPGLQAYKKLKNDGTKTGVALSKDICLRKKVDGIHLLYMQFDIGVIELTEDKFYLSSKFPDTVRKIKEVVCSLLKK